MHETPRSRREDMTTTARAPRYRVIWTPFDAEMREAMLRPTAGPVYYDGPEVEAFEHEAVRYLGGGHALGVGSGTAALHLAMLGLGLGPGDDVIVPANAYLAAAECVLQVGARPVYCDVLEDTANLDASTVAPHLTPRTKAIVAVHTYGQAVDMDPLMHMAARARVHVIEDIAHAFGGMYNGRRLGTIGDAAATSFARKGVTVAGQGGMAFTRHDDVYQRMVRLHRHGWDRGDAYRAAVHAVGFNYTLTESLAAVGRVSLARLDANNRARGANAARYSAELARRGVPVRPFAVMPRAGHAWLHYVVRAPERDRLLTHLGEHGIVAGIHYRSLVYRMPAYVTRTGSDPGPRPVTDRLAGEILTLPSHPDMGDGIGEVIDAMEAYYAGR